MYNVNEVAQKIGKSVHTVKNWYRCEREQLKDGSISETYLPQPQRMEHLLGKPLMWSDEDIEKLIEHRDSIKFGRYGVLGKYTNPDNKDFIYRKDR